MKRVAAPERTRERLRAFTPNNLFAGSIRYRHPVRNDHEPKQLRPPEWLRLPASLRAAWCSATRSRITRVQTAGPQLVTDLRARRIDERPRRP
jgi:hypothetical protein